MREKLPLPLFPPLAMPPVDVPSPPHTLAPSSLDAASCYTAPLPSRSDETLLREPAAAQRPVPEALLQDLWRRQHFDTGALHTTDGRSLTVLDPGSHNTDAGPDFREAHVRVGEHAWHGDVEIHPASSGWRLDRRPHPRGRQPATRTGAGPAPDGPAARVAARLSHPRGGNAFLRPALGRGARARAHALDRRDDRRAPGSEKRAPRRPLL
ncbi:MAG: hypothetical protein BRD52_01715 [Bacteroidetes bacterium SW_4_67_19]|nr:MAG: hypothetical protein BRD52_01715 [Bacteroidetes bacterium SW_4_67_19]